jgi:hypothetical protein
MFSAVFEYYALSAHSEYSMYFKREWIKNYKLTEIKNILPILKYMCKTDLAWGGVWQGLSINTFRHSVPQRSVHCSVYSIYYIPNPTSTDYIFLLEMKQGWCICPLSWRVHCNFTGDVLVNVMKGVGRAPPPTPAWANFTLMIECTPESSRYYSVYSVPTSASKKSSYIKEEKGLKNTHRECLIFLSQETKTQRLLDCVL